MESCLGRDAISYFYANHGCSKEDATRLRYNLIHISRQRAHMRTTWLGLAAVVRASQSRYRLRVLAYKSEVLPLLWVVWCWSQLAMFVGWRVRGRLIIGPNRPYALALIV